MPSLYAALPPFLPPAPKPCLPHLLHGRCNRRSHIFPSQVTRRFSAWIELAWGDNVKRNPCPLAAGDSIVHHPIAVVDGPTGKQLSVMSFPFTVNAIHQINFGVEGLFLAETTFNSTSSTILFRINMDGSLTNLGDRSKYNRAGEVLLYTQPLLTVDSATNPHSVSGIDIVNQANVWTSVDAFLVGTNFTGGKGWPHFSTHYYRCTLFPTFALVWNCASDGVDVLASVALYDLTNGRLVSQSMNFTLTNLTHPEANPTLWEFTVQSAFAVRSDEYWYMLDIPSLKVINQGRWNDNNTGNEGNAWLTDVDGSYILLDYGYTNNTIEGFSTRAVTNQPNILQNRDGGLQGSEEETTYEAGSGISSMWFICLTTSILLLSFIIYRGCVRSVLKKNVLDQQLLETPVKA